MIDRKYNYERNTESVQMMVIRRGKADVRWWDFAGWRLRGVHWLEPLERLARNCECSAQQQDAILAQVRLKKKPCVGLLFFVAILALERPLVWSTEGGVWHFWKSRKKKKKQPGKASQHLGKRKTREQRVGFFFLHGTILIFSSASGVCNRGGCGHGREGL